MPFLQGHLLIDLLVYFGFIYLSSLINIFIVILLYFPPIVSIEENCSKFGEFGNGWEKKKRVFGEFECFRLRFWAFLRSKFFLWLFLFKNYFCYDKTDNDAYDNTTEDRGNDYLPHTKQLSASSYHNPFYASTLFTLELNNVNISTKRTIVSISLTEVVNTNTTFFSFILSKTFSTNALGRRRTEFGCYLAFSAFRTNIRGSSVKQRYFNRTCFSCFTTVRTFSAFTFVINDCSSSVNCYVAEDFITTIT